MANEIRIDAYLAQNGYFDSRSRAAGAIAAGRVFVGGKRVEKPSEKFGEGKEIEILPAEEYAGRGAYKLLCALDSFRICLEGAVCLDAGASTGGFTDVMLRRGARLVYAVDVGRSQLAKGLLRDKRVISMEGTDIRALAPESLPHAPDFCAADLSFISLRLVLPSLLALMGEKGLVALIKPQFEAGRDKIGKNGVVRDKKVHVEVLSGVISAVRENGARVLGLVPSPIPGKEGNREYLIYISGKGEENIPDLSRTAALAFEQGAPPEAKGVPGI